MIRIQNLSLTIDQKTIFSDVSFSIKPNETIAIVGISGSGKTSLIKSIAGLYPQTQGVVNTGPNPLNPGVIFQQSGLYPWLTVFQNLTLISGLQGLTIQQKRMVADKILNQVRLSGCLDKYPNQLSGGMAQRVEIARTFFNNHNLILMDEPFSKLDVQTKESMYELFKKISRKHQIPTVLVTHDITEAIHLADRILVLSGNPSTINHSFMVRDFRLLHLNKSDKLYQRIKSVLQQGFSMN